MCGDKDLNWRGESQVCKFTTMATVIVFEDHNTLIFYVDVVRF